MSSKQYTGNAILGLSIVGILIGSIMGMGLYAWAASQNPSASPSLLTVPNINFTSGLYKGDIDATDLIDYPELPASLIAFQEGSTYRLKNCSSGLIVANSSSGESVVRWAVGNLTTGRDWKERVDVKGNYSVGSSVIIVPSNTVLDLSEARFDLTANVNMFRIGTLANLGKNVDIIGGRLYGADRSKNAIVVNGQFVTIRRTSISNFHDHAITIEGAGTFVAGTMAHSIRIEKCTFVDDLTALYLDQHCAFVYFDHNYVNGQYLSNSKGIDTASDLGILSGGFYITENLFYALGTYGIHGRGMEWYIVRNYFWKIMRHGILFQSQSGNSIFTMAKIHQNEFWNIGIEQTNTYSSIVLQGQAGYPISQVHVTDNIFNHENSQPNVTKYCIYEIAPAGNNTFIGNEFYYSQFDQWAYGTAAILSVGSGNIIKDNLGWLTENSGSDTNDTATSFTFAHGLAGEPTGVWASFNTTAVTAWTWAANENQIQITVSGTGLPGKMEVYWDAKYIP
jgi:hypothetical protein